MSIVRSNFKRSSEFRRAFRRAPVMTLVFAGLFGCGGSLREPYQARGSRCPDTDVVRRAQCLAAQPSLPNEPSYCAVHLASRIDRCSSDASICRPGVCAGYVTGGTGWVTFVSYHEMSFECAHPNAEAWGGAGPEGAGRETAELKARYESSHPGSLVYARDIAAGSIDAPIPVGGSTVEVDAVGTACVTDQATAEIANRKAQESEAVAAAQARLAQERAQEEAQRHKLDAGAAETRRRAVASIVQDCTSQWLSQSNRCAEVPGLSSDERTWCQNQCAYGGAQGYSAALRSAQNSCAAATTSPKCDLTRPPQAFVDDVQFKSDLAACAKGCRYDRSAAAEAARKDAASAAREAAAAAARARAEAGAARARGGSSPWCDGCSAEARLCASQCANFQCKADCAAQGVKCLQRGDCN